MATYVCLYFSNFAFEYIYTVKAHRLETLPPRGPSPVCFSDQRAAPTWGLKPARSGPQLSSDHSFLPSVCRPGWPRLKADSQHAANRPVGTAACTMCRTPPPSTTVHRIGRGTVSVRRLLLTLYLFLNSGIRDEHKVLVRSQASVMIGL